MNKKILLIVILCLVASLSFLEVKFVSENRKVTKKDKEMQIVTSFYPIYIIMLNLLDGIDDIFVVNLTNNQQGCLHDYQLTTKDMRTLQHADLFVLNGGGMESFVEDIISQYHNLQVLDSSVGITMSEGMGHHHEEEEEHKAEWNAHIWMNPDYYIKQIQNITEYLIHYVPLYEERVTRNADQYIHEIKLIKEQMNVELKEIEGEKTIIFHEAFAYLCEYLNIDVVHCVDLDTESGLSAGEVAHVTQEIREEHISYLFVEKQSDNSIAQSIATETNTIVYELNALVAGENEKDSYINGMKHNIEVLKFVLQDGVK